MHWTAHIEALHDFINDPSPTARVSAQWRLEALEELLQEREEEERRELEELVRWSDQQEAEILMQQEAHSHAQGLCD